MESQSGTGSAYFEPGDIYESIVPLQDEDDAFWFEEHQQFPAEGSAYYLQPASFADSTSYASDPFDHSLTQESTLTSALEELPPGAAELHQWEEADPTAGRQSYDDPSEARVVLKNIGEAPGIYVPGQLARPPLLPTGDEFSTRLTPHGYATTLRGGGREVVPELALDPSAGVPDLSFLSTLSPAVDTAPPSSQPMRRGRSKGLSEQARKKAADMRDVGACDRCRIRRVQVRQKYCGGNAPSKVRHTSLT